MKSLLRLWLFLFLIAAVSAEEQTLLTATNDKDSRTEELVLRLDDAGRLDRLIHRLDAKDKLYTVADLEAGAVLRRQSGNDVLFLTIEDFEPLKGALVRIKYLYNGIPPAEYRQLTFELRKKGGLWGLFQAQNVKPITALRFLTNYATIFGFVQPVGIKDVQIIR